MFSNDSNSFVCPDQGVLQQDPGESGLWRYQELRRERGGHGHLHQVGGSTWLWLHDELYLSSLPRLTRTVQVHWLPVPSIRCATSSGDNCTISFQLPVQTLALHWFSAGTVSSVDSLALPVNMLAHSLSRLAVSHTWGDIFRSIPFIMCGHQNWDIFQNLLASLFDPNPANKYPMMILKHSGQAPTSFGQIFHSMSLREMSTHDIKTKIDFFKLNLWRSSLLMC